MMFAAILTMLAAMPAYAVIISSDSAADAVYAGGWTNGANGGAGFGAWSQMTTVASSNNDGFFIGSSTSNGVAIPSGGIDVGGKSWGLYANGHDHVNSAFSEAYRPFAGALTPGQTVVVKMDNGGIDGGGMVGIALLNQDPAAVNNIFTALPNSTTRFALTFSGGDTNYNINLGNFAGGTTVTINTGIGFTDGGLTVAFTLNSNDTFSVSINGGAPITGSLGGQTNQTINGIALFNYVAGATRNNDLYFNSLQIWQPPPNHGAFKPLAFDGASDSTYASGWSNGANGGDGFGAWSFSTGATGNGGQFAGTSQNNGATNGNIDTTGRAWGLWANGGGSINAIRPFGFTLQAGDSFAADVDTGYIDAGGQVGFMLTGFGDPRSSSQISFLFRGGGTNFVINAGKYYWTMETNTGVAFTSKGVHVVVTLGELGAFTCAITPNGGVTTVVKCIDPAGAGGLDHVELFNSNAGSGSSHDAFFNNLTLTENIAAAAFDNASDGNYAGRWSTGGSGGSGWSNGWNVTVSGSTGATGGSFIGSSPMIDGDGQAFGLYAGGNGASVLASRLFTQPLGLGDSFTMDIQNRFVQTNSLVAFQLLGGGVQWQFGFPGGGTNYQIGVFTYLGPNYVDTGVPFTTNGVHVVVTQGADTNGLFTYTAAITPKGGATRIVTGPLHGGFGGSVTIPVLNEVELYTDNPPGPTNDVYFNNLAIIPAPRLAGVSLTTNAVATISFTPSGVLWHDLLASDDLQTPNWSVLSSNLIGSGNSQIQVQDPAAGTHGKRFYRLRAINH